MYKTVKYKRGIIKHEQDYNTTEIFTIINRKQVFCVTAWFRQVYIWAKSI